MTRLTTGTQPYQLTDLLVGKLRQNGRIESEKLKIKFYVYASFRMDIVAVDGNHQVIREKIEDGVLRPEGILVRQFWISNRSSM